MYSFFRPLPAVRSLAADTRAVTAIEYVLIASLVAVALITGAKAIGLDLSATFSKVAGAL